MNFDIEAFVKGFIRKSVTRLFLSFIHILEDMVADGRVSQEEFQRLRKRILDNGNSTIRDIDTELKNFEFIIRNKNNT